MFYLSADYLFISLQNIKKCEKFQSQFPRAQNDIHIAFFVKPTIEKLIKT